MKSISLIRTLLLLVRAVIPLGVFLLAGVALAAPPRLEIRAPAPGAELEFTTALLPCQAPGAYLQVAFESGGRWFYAPSFWNIPLSITPPPVTGTLATVKFRLERGTLDAGLAAAHLPSAQFRLVADAPVIDFFALPAEFSTHLPDFVVIGVQRPGEEALVNGVPVPAAYLGGTGHFAVPVALTNGANPLRMTVRSLADGTLQRDVTRVVRRDAAFSTAGARLLYVVCPAGETALDGTLVFDLDRDVLLGYLPGLYARDLSPDGRELYLNSRAVLGTDFHQPLRTLPFSGDLPLSGFIVSPEGSNLFSGVEVVSVADNTLLPVTLGLDLNAYLGQWSGATPAGRPCAGLNGVIFGYAGTVRHNWQTGELTSTGFRPYYFGDARLLPARNLFLVTHYGYGDGSLHVLDASTFEVKAVVPGLHDFVGEIGFLGGGRYVVVGSSGNALFTDGYLTIVDLNDYSVVQQVYAPLANNLSTDNAGEIHVATGLSSDDCSRTGVDVYQFTPGQPLRRTKTYFLGGPNRSTPVIGAPTWDTVVRILYKPARLAAL